MAKREGIVVGSLLTVYFLLTVTSSLDKCNTYDEIAHLTAGYSYWLENDYRLQPENGNWPQRWAALPLLIGRPAFPSLDRQAWYRSDVWTLGREFFFDLDNDPASLLLQGRAMVALLGVLLGLLVYFYARMLFGVSGAMLSLALCVFCPTFLAHGGLITSDVAAGLFFLAVIWTSWCVLHEVTVWTVFLGGLALGGLFLSKFSAVIIVPTLLFMGLVRLIDGRPLVLRFRTSLPITSRPMIAFCLAGVFMVQLFIVWTLIWLSFGCHSDTFVEGEVEQEYFPGGWAFVLQEREQWVNDTLLWVRDHDLLPEPYVFGFAFTLRYAQQRAAFLNGEHSIHGWPWFFPFAFLVKTPLATLGILALAALGIGLPRDRAAWRGAWGRWYNFVPLWIFLVVFGAFAIKSPLNIGQRHILPVYPVLYIMAGAAMTWWQADLWKVASHWKSAVAATTLQLCLCWLVVETVWRWPHYLAYFNQVVGGPANGYKHLVDSSLDWGQDLPGLKSWLDRQDSTTHVYLDYFGSARPLYYVPQARLLRGERRVLPETIEPPGPGVYCISATRLQGVYDNPWDGATEKRYRLLLKLIKGYDAPGLERLGNESLWLALVNEYHDLSARRLCLYLRHRKPDDNVGYSILIYRLGASELKLALGTQGS